jgi:hypothetical protein
MARIIITCDVPDDMTDSSDRTGLTEEGYDEVSDALIGLGCTDIDTRSGE